MVPVDAGCGNYFYLGLLRVQADGQLTQFDNSHPRTR
jgi:hypothetical protein